MTTQRVAFSEWHEAFKPTLAELQAAASEPDGGAQMRESTVLARAAIKRLVAIAKHVELSLTEGDEGRSG